MTKINKQDSAGVEFIETQNVSEQYSVIIRCG